jgi:hypothetical protein
MNQTEEIRLTRSFQGLARPLAAAALIAMVAACGGDKGGDGKAANGGDTKAGDPAAQKGAQQQPVQQQAPQAVQDSLRNGFFAQLAMDTAGAGAIKADSTGKLAQQYLAGQNPQFAVENGWPVKRDVPLPGSLLPYHRIVAYYGNPLSTRMGVLGEYQPQEMLHRWDQAVAAWNQADPHTPVIPALHLIVVVAQGAPGSTGKYRMIMPDTLVEKVYGWARSRHGILFIDIQTGLSTIQEMLPQFEHFLTRPDVHLAVDPEFMMVYSGAKPGTKIGTMRASDVNYVIGELDRIVRQNHLPPKVLVIHRFTRNMVPDAENIHPTPNVQVVMNMDGWGAPWLKRDSYKDYIVRHPVEFTGFKIFYHNDIKKAGSTLMGPADVLKFRPRPHYIQYQ